jgi:hypothetical protein
MREQTQGCGRKLLELELWDKASREVMRFEWQRWLWKQQTTAAALPQQQEQQSKQFDNAEDAEPG